ncbi:MAG: hypothetical protein HY258_00030, partial [Chloroflexi bacterium]|nr:hypothetical protein [Chloroflexota bacterium]
MVITIFEIDPKQLDEYSLIPIRFEVSSIFDVDLVNGGLGGITLHERKVEPYIKDYDELENPLDWPSQFDVSHWGFFLAHDGTQN